MDREKSRIIFYVDTRGKEPVKTWLGKLDPPRRMRIVKRLERIELGNLGDHKFIGQGLAELREDHGAGYRIYLCFWRGQTIVLLAAGNKATQSKDIEQAKQRMAEYVDRK